MKSLLRIARNLKGRKSQDDGVHELPDEPKEIHELSAQSEQTRDLEGILVGR